MHKDTDRQIKVDFTKSASQRGTSVSSVSWASEGTQTLDITSESLSSDVATAYVSAAWSGFGLLKVAATFADGNTETIYIHIRVYSPEDE